MHYIWQICGDFLQISFKGQRLLIVLVLGGFFYCFEAICLIFFFFFNILVFWEFEIYQYLGSFKFTDSFFEDMTKIMAGYFYVMNSTKSVYLEIRLAFTKAS